MTHCKHCGAAIEPAASNVSPGHDAVWATRNSRGDLTCSANASGHVPVPTFELNAYELEDAVHVHAYGSWYVGEVVKVGRTNVTVLFSTGSGAVHTKSINPAGPWGSALLLPLAVTPPPSTRERSTARRRAQR